MHVQRMLKSLMKGEMVSAREKERRLRHQLRQAEDLVRVQSLGLRI
jgi:hypothetical protein